MDGSLAKFCMRTLSDTCLLLGCEGGLSWEDREGLAQEAQRFAETHSGVTDAVVDLGKVDFVNSAGLGALFQFIRAMRARGGRVAFANVPPTIHRMFTAVGLDKVARIAPNIQAAQAVLADAASPEPTTT